MKPLYMPIRRVGLRVENGAGWQIVCNQCTAPTILANSHLRVRVPYVCASCAPGQVLQGGEPDAIEQAERCEAEAEQSERSAMESRRFAAKHERAGMHGLAAASVAAAEQAETWAQQKRTEAAGWRRASEGGTAA